MKNLLLSQGRCKCLGWETNAGRRRYLDIQSTSVSSKAVAFGCGGVKLEVVNLQRLQSHRGAFWVMTMMYCADCYALAAENTALLYMHLLGCACPLLPHTHTHKNTRTHTHTHEWGPVRTSSNLDFMWQQRGVTTLQCSALCSQSIYSSHWGLVSLAWISQAFDFLF